MSSIIDMETPLCTIFENEIINVSWTGEICRIRKRGVGIYEEGKKTNALSANLADTDSRFSCKVVGVALSCFSYYIE